MTSVSFFVTGIFFIILSLIFGNIWSYYVPASLVLLTLWLKAIQPIWLKRKDTLKVKLIKLEPSAAGGWISIISVVYGIISLIMGNWIQFAICIAIFVLSLTMKFPHPY